MKNIVLFVSTLAIFFVFAPQSKSVFGATLMFDPEAISTDSGKTFSIDVNVDAGTTEIKGTEVFITYDSSLLEIQADSIKSGGLFKTFQKESTAGKVYMVGLAETAADVVSSPGTLGSITFKALTDGTATLEFYCDSEAQKGSSIIKNDDNNTNLIECASNGTSSVVIGTGVNDTALTPTAIAQESRPTPVTPSTLPVSGVFDNVVKFAVPGAILLLIGTVARVLL